MESGEVADASPLSVNEGNPPSLAAWLDELCIYYMRRGVGFDEFWYGDYCRLPYYERLYEISCEARNEACWLAGLYHFEGTALALSNAFRKKGSPPASYPSRPHAVTEAERGRREEEARRQDQALARDWLASFASRHNQNFQKEAGNCQLK